MLLEQAGGKVNITAGGATPLHVAADIGNSELITCLLKSGADPNVIDEEDWKPVQVATLRGNRGAVEVLFPVSSHVETIPKWSVDGIIQYMQSEGSKNQKFEEAANAFYEGVKLDPENKELVHAFREAIDAGRAFHGTKNDKEK
ncbi:hypothetical protein LXL04_026116 [Taraxacum kok-saghyz]